MTPLTYVVGFDPGLANAGIAIVDTVALRCHRAWTVKTKSGEALQARLATIEAQLRAALYDHLDGAGLLAIEDQHQTFFAMLAKGRSNAAAGQLERIVGIAHGLAAARSIPVVMVTPQRIRIRLGLSGNAKKEQIGRAVAMQLSGVLAGLSSHALDATGIALAGAREWRGMRAQRGTGT